MRINNFLKKTPEDFQLSGLKKLKVVLVLVLFVKLLTFIYDIFFRTFYLCQEDLIVTIFSENIMVVYILFLGPLLEEGSFRFFNFQEDLKTILISISLFLSYIVVFFFLNDNDIMLLENKFPFSFFFVNVLLATCVYFILILCQAFLEKGLRFFVKYKIQLVYLSSILFAFSHLKEFRIENCSAMSNLLFVIPFFFLGIGASLVRIRLGFRYAIIFHILFNLPAGIYLMVQ